MKKSMGKRLISGVTSAVLAVTYTCNLDGLIPGLRDGSLVKPKVANAASDGTPHDKDGLPLLNMGYESSRWYRGGPLGIAGDFHIFAFDSATVDKHTNGNVAAPTVIGGNASPNQYIGRLVNVVGQQWDTNVVTLNNISDVVIPADYELYAQIPEDGKLAYPSDKMKFNLYDTEHNKIDMNSNADVPSYMGHWTENFMNFEELETYYDALSDNFANKPNSVKNYQIVDTTDNDRDIYIWLNPEGENVINLKPEDFLNSQGGADHCKIHILGLNLEEHMTTYTDKYGNPVEVMGTRINGNQSLIFNIDLDGFEGDTFDFENYSRNIEYYGIETADISIADVAGADKLEIKNGEGTVVNGTNVLLNFAHAPECVDNEPGLRVNVGLSTNSILAPDIDLHVNNTNGTFIAQDVTVEGETHMAYFMQPLSNKTEGDITVDKTWSDGNELHSADEVRVTLYRTITGDVDLSRLADMADAEKTRYEEGLRTEDENRANALAELWKNSALFEETVPKNNDLPEGYKYDENVEPNNDIKLFIRALETSGDKKGEPRDNGDILQNINGIGDRKLRYSFDDYSIGVINAEKINDEEGTHYEFKDYNDIFTFDPETKAIKVSDALLTKLNETDTYNDTFWIGFPYKEDNKDKFDRGIKFSIDSEGNVVSIDGGPVSEVYALQCEKVDTQTLNAGNAWSYKWEDLPKLNDDGFTWFYYIVEEPVEDYETSYENNGLVGGQDVVIDVTNSKDETPDKQTAFRISKNLSEDGAITSDVVEGAKFVLSKADGSSLANVYAGKPEELASLRANVKSADTAITKGDASKNYKALEISGCTSGTGYTIIGNDLSYFMADGADISSLATRNSVTNKYEYRGTINGDKLLVDGFTQGNYTIILSDGTEYKINAKGEETSLTVADDVLVNKKAELSSDGTFEFVGGQIEINNLPAGRYTLKETASPNGYEKVNTTFTFDVDEDGKVSLAAVSSYGEITVTA
ncbi:MAG TPA: SpaA isopeptide-forming pilin-related protein, partial [Ruminococcus sp.]|nr:SpaA isopeptide-forming pilin-related protein [Ruminococcus sp.]